MKTIKLRMILLLIAALLVTFLVQVKAEKIPKAEKAQRKVTSVQPKQQPQPTHPSQQVRPAETTFETVPLSVPEFTTNQYVLVTGVLDEFGRPSESDSFKIQISCGGQPTPVGIPAGISESSNYQVRHGYAHTAAVLHGDCNADGIINLADVVYLTAYLFGGGDPPIPLEAGDVNCDGIINLGDLVYLQNYLWRGGPPPCDPPS